MLRLVEQLDSVPRQYLQKLSGTEDLWEVRAQHGGHAFRLLGFVAPPVRLVLTSGLAKKSEKTPRKELGLAEDRRRDYLNRARHHE